MCELYTVFSVIYLYFILIGNKHRAGHPLQRQGEEADEADEIWRLFNTTGLIMIELSLLKIISILKFYNGPLYLGL